jgi:hypothetical protein
MLQNTMRQNYMLQSYKIAILLSSLLSNLLMGTAGYGQSLGDVARQQRQKQQAKKADASRKVITNEDIPEHPESASEAETASGTSGSDSEGGDSSFRSASEVAKSGEQWKAAIQAQKSAIANFQSQLDKLNDSIHFVEANRYSNGVQYNQHQLKKKQEAERAQKQLDEQKKKLADMQETARKAGFGSSVYDP